MSTNIDIEAVKAATDVTRIIRETVVLHKNGHYLVGLCPFHAEKTPSFLAFPDHFHCFGCGKHGDAIDWLTLGCGMSFGEALDYLSGGGSGTVMEGKKPKRQAEGDDKRNVDLARRIWGECTTATCTIVEDYLRSRGLTLPPMAFRFLRHCGANGTVLRFHPQCPRGKEEREPAMVALMTDPETQEPRGIHRTFLRPDGSGHTGRMMLGHAGIIRLYEPLTAGIGLAEGIETALAVAQRIGWGPVWAASTAGGIERFPPLVMRTLNIFVDRDDDGVGLRAAMACAERRAEASLETFIHEPPVGEDWCDAAARIEP
jgi:hypothetical protein